MEARFFTDIGVTRARNEDAGGVFINRTGQQLLLICDGMGGHNAGDVASQFVKEQLQYRFEQENLIELSQAQEWLKRHLTEINHELYQLAHQDNAYQGMGTTIVAAIIYEEKIVIANIGDSRAYLINDRDFRQVTNDHTFVNHLVMAGELTKEEAAVHPQRNIITKVLGTDKRVYPDLFVYETKRYDMVMLSSDGLTDYVEESVIHQLLQQNKPLEAVGQELITAAIQSEVRDNVSCVIGRFGGVQ